jgi:hypothetical protein
MVKHHLGWKLALNLSLNDRGFHATTLVNFRQRLLENDKGQVAFQAVIDALQKEGLIPKRAKQRLDSTHVLAAVRDMSALECVRETLRLGLEALQKELDAAERPEFWAELWERYVENKLDFRSAPEVLKSKQRQSGIDAKRLLEWVEPMRGEVRYAPAVELLRAVLGQHTRWSKARFKGLRSMPPGWCVILTMWMRSGRPKRKNVGLATKSRCPRRSQRTQSEAKSQWVALSPRWVLAHGAASIHYTVDVRGRTSGCQAHERGFLRSYLTTPELRLAEACSSPTSTSCFVYCIDAAPFLGA